MKQIKSVDWTAIRAEYCRGGTSYRKLAAKYGIAYVKLARRAKEEGWISKKSSSPNTAQAVAEELNRLLYEWVQSLEHPAVGEIDKAAAALKKIQDVEQTAAEESDHNIILCHQVPRAEKGAQQDDH